MTDQLSAAATSITASNRRTADRIRVLFRGIIITPHGDNAADCMIEDISIRGAKIRCSRDLRIGEEIYLLDTQNRSAYYAKVAWQRSQKAGLSFIRTYELNLGLPLEKDFLELHLIKSKLRQIAALEGKGIQLDEAASLVGLTESELTKIALDSDSEAKLLTHRLMPLVTKSDRNQSGETSA